MEEKPHIVSGVIMLKKFFFKIIAHIVYKNKVNVPSKKP